MKFYRMSLSVFSTTVLMCQDSFKGICNKSSAATSFMSVPIKQFTTVESINRETYRFLRNAPQMWRK